MSDMGCDGAVVYAQEWCPDCDANTPHIRIGIDAKECQECGELSIYATMLRFPVEDCK